MVSWTPSPGDEFEPLLADVLSTTTHALPDIPACTRVTCPPATSQCKVAGTCQEPAGVCSQETNVEDGTPCDDSNSVTSDDVCTAGECSGIVDCSPGAFECGWTADWSCPGQPQGNHGAAGNDGSHNYICCCDQGHWEDEQVASSPPSGTGVRNDGGSHDCGGDPCCECHDTCDDQDCHTS